MMHGQKNIKLFSTYLQAIIRLIYKNILKKLYSISYSLWDVAVPKAVERRNTE